MAVKIKMYTLIFCFLVVGICGECLFNMSSTTKRVIEAGDGMPNFHIAGMVRSRNYGHRRR